jgi:2-polyprenyl-3-methyl-5-hydroxy-6-metoxy-1,4-benzoquinol methylase
MKTDFFCIVCNSQDGRQIYEQYLPDLNYDLNPSKLEEHKIDYWLCESCGSVMQFPLPTINLLSNYYKTTVTPQTDLEIYSSYKHSLFSERVQLILNITQIQPPNRVLEIGCANGDFLNRFDKKGFSVAGIEPSEKASKIARDHFGINVKTGVIESLDLDRFERQFDLALSMHTLEHVLNPQLFVSKIAKCVKLGGWLYLEVPDNNKVPGESICAWGDQIMSVHITHFTPHALILMLMKEGLSIQHVSCVAKFRYPSICIFAQKISAATNGESAFKFAAGYQENLYKVAGEHLIKMLSKEQRVLLWGAGSDLYQTLKYTPKLKQYELEIVDINPKKIGKYFFGYKVFSPENKRQSDLIVATPASPLLCENIEKDANKLYPNISVKRLFL